MTVYFAQPVTDTSQVKIGHSNDVEKRLALLGSSFEGGVELLAQCDGGAEVEAVFHILLAEDRIEGEWFRRSDLLNRIVDTFKDRVTGQRVFGRMRSVVEMEDCPIAKDKELAAHEIQTLMGRFGSVGKGIALSNSFTVLSSINPAWSRRRVRAMLYREAASVSLFEFRDMQRANAMTDSEVARALSSKALAD